MILLKLLKQDIRVAIRNISDLALLNIFIVLSALLFPLAIGPEPQILARIATGLIWVLVLFSTQIAIPSIWQQDLADGTVEQYRLSGLLLEWFVLSKVLSSWFIHYGCILCLIPFLGFALEMKAQQISQLCLTFTIVSIPLSFLCSTGGLLSYDSNKSSILSSIILLPLYIPLLIFSCAICDQNNQGDKTPLFLFLISYGLILSPSLLYLNVFLMKENR